ncbi:MAG: ornithine carbamoyltransferase, partial [Eubacteriales bacterium]
MRPLKGRSILGINELSTDEIEFILGVSHDFKRKWRSGELHEYLRGKSLAGVFNTQSTRTSCSFETAMTALGGHMLWLDKNRIWSGDAGGENWHDTVKTLTRYVHGTAHRPVTREMLEETANLAT